MENITRKGFLTATAVAGLGLTHAASSAIASEKKDVQTSTKKETSAAAEGEAHATSVDAGKPGRVAPATASAFDLTPIDESKLMPEDLGQEWHEFKASCGPLYPGYENWEKYLDYIEEKLTEYGCVDKLENSWDIESYIVDDWPDHDNGSMTLSIDGKSIPVATNLRLSGDKDHQEVTGDLVVVDIDTDVKKIEEGAYEGKIVVIKTNPMPEPPYTDDFKMSYVVTDTNYRSDPEPPAPMFQRVDPTVNTSWNNRWDFGQWGTANKIMFAGKAAGGIILSSLTYGNLCGLVDRQNFRNPAPVICVDRTQKDAILAAAEEGKSATITLKADYLKTTDRNFFMFLPGKYYGTENDEYVTINSHSDAMGLTQDNGALCTLGIMHYFSQIPQEQRNKTLVACIDTRHFIEGFENGNFQYDPYQVFPDVAAKTSVTIGLEHLGTMEGAEDYEKNTIVPTGNPEYAFMKSDDNDWCARILIQAAIDSGCERADVKIDGRPGNSGQYKGLVRAVQASTHKLPVAAIGEAGNWPGTATQEFTGIEYFGKKHFRDEIALWTQVTSNFMDVDRRVYDICWSNLNSAIRNLGAKEIVSDDVMNGMLGNVADIFGQAEKYDFKGAAARLEKELKGTLKMLAPADYDFDRVPETTAGYFGSLSYQDGEEYLAVWYMADKVIADLED